MKFNIPEHCYIRWQAALAVLEDLQEDVDAPFNMFTWADRKTLWERTNGCGSIACFAGYISVATYCIELGFPKFDNGWGAGQWLLDNENTFAADYPHSNMHGELFSEELDQGSKKKTLAFLKRRIKKTFKESTGENLVAPMTFYVE